MSYDEERAWYGGSFSSAPAPPPPPPLELSGPTPETPIDWVKRVAALVDVTPHEGPALVMGRFDPLHAGHAYLLQTAAKACKTVIVAVWRPARQASTWWPVLSRAVLDALPPSFEHRAYPEHALTQPGTPDTPGFWEPWVRWFREPSQQWHYGACRTLVSSDEKAKGFADAVGLRFLLVDPQRKTVPLSSTMVRADPWTHWAQIAPALRSSFAKVVALVGPEGAGKSRLTHELAAHYGTAAVGEYLRTWTTAERRAPTYEDLIGPVAREQSASLQQLQRRAKKFGFADTEGLTLQLWCHRLFRKELPDYVSARRADFYLVLDDAPWTQEPERDRPQERKQFVADLKANLANVPHAFISGPREGRLAQCLAAIDAWVATNPAKVRG